jgi:hypothetical protein
LERSRLQVSRTALGLAAAGLLWAGTAAAQVTPAAGYTPPDDTPSIGVGVTLFTDYTYTASPEKTDSDGNLYHPSSFNTSRTYINFNGKISHLVSFRITPDIQRQTNGDLGFRLKYGFMQVNLDEWTTAGTWVRFGQNQTPYVDYEEGIYRYRFQGTTFPEREGYLTSSDIGASFHYNFTNNFGEIHTGLYNGEGYHAPEANNQPAFQIRGTIRPFARGSMVARGLNITGFYDADNYVKNGEKKRAMFEVYFQHKYLRTAVTYLNTRDQKSATGLDAHGQGWSIWATPISTKGWEGLFRYDHMTPNTDFSSQLHKRTIVGVSYWFPHKGGPTAALLFDYDLAQFPNLGQPDEKKIAVHALINY